MAQEPTDVVAYKLWLVSSPFVLQPPAPPQLNGHVLLNQDPRNMPLPVSEAQPPMTAVNGCHSNTTPSGVQQSQRGRKKSISADSNGSFTSPSANSNDSCVSSNAGDGANSELTRRLQNDSNAFLGPGSLQDGGQYGGQAPMGRTVCGTCGKWFRSRQQLTQHMLVHTDVRKYRCSFCGRAFKQPSHLQQHHRIHTGEKPYRCPLAGCTRAFPQLSNLNHHVRNHDKPDPPAENTCSFCSRTYASEAVLKNHMAKIHMFDCDSPAKEMLTTEKADSILSVSGNQPALSHATNSQSPPDIPFHPLSLAGTYSDRLRHLAAQPKLENVTSGEERKPISTDLLKAQANEMMDRARTESFMNIMNSYQIFNTIPLDKLRRCKEAVDGMNVKMDDVAEGFTRTSSTDPVTNSSRSSPEVSAYMAGSKRMSLPTRAMPYADVNVKNSSPSQTVAVWNQENCQNSSQQDVLMNEKIAENLDEKRSQRRKRAPVKLTSPGVTTAGGNVSNGHSLSYNGSDISVCENYTYTLENSEQILAQWRQRYANGHVASTPVDDDNNDTPSSDSSSHELEESHEKPVENPKRLLNDKFSENARTDGESELFNEEPSIAKRSCLENERGGYTLCRTEIPPNINEDSTNISNERNIEGSQLVTSSPESNSPDTMMPDIHVAAPRMTAAPSPSHKGQYDDDETHIQTPAPTSNSRKRKAFQPQRVVHGGEMAEYCI